MSLAWHPFSSVGWDDLEETTFTQKTSPLLYAWVRHPEVLYIGQSENGVGRIYNQHHVINKLAAVLKDDKFYLMFLPRHVLREHEASWIKYYAPRYNIIHNPGHRRDLEYAITLEERDAALANMDAEDATPEQVLTATNTLLHGVRPKLLGKYCTYDCQCSVCRTHRALALQ